MKRSNAANKKNIEDIRRKVLTALEAQDPQAEIEYPNNVKQLYTAIKAGNLQKTKELLTIDKTIIDVEYKHVTPLRNAANNQHWEIIKFLLDHKADVNKAYLRISDPIILDNAAENKSLEEVQRLSNSTVLHAAAESGQLEIVALLLKYNADVYAKNGSGATPLHLASQNGHPGVVRILLNYNADVNSADTKGLSPLHLAVQNAHPSVIKMLLSYNANINATDTNNVTPLFIAAINGYLEIAAILLENNANAHTAHRDGRTPLKVASDYGRMRIVGLLKSHQELCTAIAKKDVPKVGILLKEGAVLPNQNKKILLEPELSPIFLQLAKKEISTIFSSIRYHFLPKNIYFKNKYLVIDFKNDKEASYFLETISILFKPTRCERTESNISVRLQWPFSADEAFTEIKLYTKRKNQLEKALYSLRQQLNASDCVITAITPGANGMDRNLKIFFQRAIVGSFALEDTQISIKIVQGGIIIELSMEFLLQQENKAMLDIYIRKITNKIAKIGAEEEQKKEEELAQKEAEALEKLRLREEMKAKEAAENRGKEKQKERKKSEKTKTTSSATEGFPHAEADDKTPLHKAVHSGNVAQVTLSLSQGTEDINAQTKKGNTALHVAAIIKNKAIFKLLMEQPTIDLTLKNEQGKTALDIAKEKGLIPHPDLASKKEVASNQPGKENPPLSEKKTSASDRPKPSDKKQALRKGDPNFFTTPVANEPPKQKESVLEDSGSKEKFMPRKQQHPPSSFSPSSSDYRLSPK